MKELVLQPNTIQHLKQLFEIAVSFAGLGCGLVIALIFAVAFRGK